MDKILVIRLSAFGDVAISAPVIKQFLIQYPDKEVLFLTNKNFVPLFGKLQRLEFITPDLKKFKGIYGLFIFFKIIKTIHNISHVIDIHDVIRTKILRFFFKLSGIKTFSIDKGRLEKRRMTRKKFKVLKQLKHSSERYADVFEKAGFKIDLNFKNKNEKATLNDDVAKIVKLKDKNIGIAPFALHIQKTYPLDKIEEVFELLNNENFKILIFGGGEKEKEFAQNIEKKCKNVFSIIGKFNLETELDLISNLDFMLTMDSSNMHLSALIGTKVISIWGATHPFLGFYPIGQNNENNYIQISENDLSCRPCSVFGNKKCYRGDLACLNNISPEIIVRKILENI
jgi:ADP-heptose:LPS heptosyltransferase